MSMNQSQKSVHLAAPLADAPCGIQAPTRAEHLAWCKERALAYIEHGDAQNAFASMASDLQKHPGTRDHIGMQLGMMQLMNGMLSDPRDMRRFIEGFN